MDQAGMSTYLTLGNASYGEYHEKGSKFLAYAFPVETAPQVRNHLMDLQKEHSKARHVCYAYRFGTGGLEFRTVDDGEPSGTAGKPILQQIDKHQVTDVVIFVVRYFGGVLLGAPGLTRAYKQAAEQAIIQGQIVSRDIVEHWVIECNFVQSQQILGILKPEPGVQIVNTVLGEPSLISVNLPLISKEEIFMKIKMKLENRKRKDIAELLPIEGISLSKNSI
ncbi:MAG: YigZ family protein [Saprospiraceae bacterium]|jgi:uncharacterized YigZ family protein|nr:YigZ family protein [Saprospiraceae bacterium]